MTSTEVARGTWRPTNSESAPWWREASRGRRLRPMLCVIAAGLAGLGAAEQAVAATSCPDVSYRVNGKVYARTYELQAKRVGCRAARKVALRFLKTAEGTPAEPRPYGYRCRSSMDGFIKTCRTGARSVRWYNDSRFGGR